MIDLAVLFIDFLLTETTLSMLLDPEIVLKYFPMGFEIV